MVVPNERHSLTWRAEHDVYQRLRRYATQHDRSINWSINHLLDKVLTESVITGSEGKLW